PPPCSPLSLHDALPISVMEKVHHIQETGLEVWCGMIVGFDTDDESVFAAQREFIRDSRIALAMVNILFAIPHTPLHARLSKEGRDRKSTRLNSSHLGIS